MEISDKEIIANRLSYFSGINHSADSIDPWLAPWESSKQQLYSIFGNELILSKEITIVEETADKERKVEAFIDKYGILLSNSFADLKGVYDCDVAGLVPKSIIMHNNLGKDLVLTHKTTGKVTKFPANTKFTRFLSQVVSKLYLAPGELYSLYFSKKINDLITEISKIHNSMVISGELCLSIHPMDYMTMSDNNCNWSSCMSWDNGGEYRLGTLEMLTSPYVVVAYVKSKDTLYKGWNSKKWRELFIVSPEMICGIKGYPYESPILERYICGWLKSLAEKKEGYSYEEEVTSVNNPAKFQTLTLNNGKTGSIKLSTNAMYNDCYLANRCILFSKNLQDGFKIDINYSGTPYCITTFQPICDSDNYPDRLTIIEYSRYYNVCGVCGAGLITDECFFDEELNAYVCDHCYDKHYIKCDYCGKVMGRLSQLKKLTDYVIINNNTYFCNNCFGWQADSLGKEKFDKLFSLDEETEEYTTTVPVTMATLFFEPWEKICSKLEKEGNQ